MPLGADDHGSSFTKFSNSTEDFKFDDDSLYQFENPANMFTFKGDPRDLNSINHSFFPHNSPDPSFVAPTLSRSLEMDSQDDILKYINFILMEENMEQKPSLFHNPLALQETEKSLCPFETTLKPTSPLSFGSMKSFSDDVNGPMNSSMSSYLFSNKFSNSNSVLQFKRGMEEASKFLCRNNQLIIDLESYILPPESDVRASDVVVKMEDGRENPPNGARGRKNHL
ncbi:Scarecrow-like protein 33 [Camellia lanceoleosa]|uniref:Scarecrow-like protein 33 n=1 Tax=Camellia lanceoleosa TaxID=1840588 RepID=A0ACC0F6T8_9ERIC|nr:Scarecrow-like protein 33 [Camellia lanceoleosa]